jgi:hypothetical protein
MRRGIVRGVCALLLVLGMAAPAAASHVLKMSFARARSEALLKTIIARQHADGGKITTCYRTSPVSVRCGLKTWKSSGSVHWTCYGHINNFFAPPSSNKVSTQSRGVYCK